MTQPGKFWDARNFRDWFNWQMLGKQEKGGTYTTSALPPPKLGTPEYINWVFGQNKQTGATGTQGTMGGAPSIPTTDMTEEEKQLDFINQTRIALGLPIYNSLAEYKADIIVSTDPFEEQRAKVRAARAEGYDLAYNKATEQYQYTPSPSESSWGQNTSDIYNKELAALRSSSQTGDISSTGNTELDNMINSVIQGGNPQMEAEVRRNYADTIYNRRQQQAATQQQQQMALYSSQPSTWLQYAQAAQNPVKVQDWMRGLLPQSYQTTQQASPSWAGQTPLTETQSTTGWKSGTVLPEFGGRKPAMWGIGNETVTGEEYNQRFGLEGTNKVAEWEDATYDWSNLPKLLTPSAQYLARMTPEQQAQYYGYEQASKKLRPEDLQYKLWGNIPTGANRGLTYRT